MSKVTVCVRFRPLNSREREVHGDSVCIQPLSSESFLFKDDKEEDAVFGFDRVFYEDSEQEDIYQFLAMPIVQDTVNGINGTIITYGQTGAGKTYSMEGIGILGDDEHKKGLLPRVVDGIFTCINSSTDIVCTVKLSMVEIYMEKVRDLLDPSKDNIQIKESKSQGIFLSGTTELCINDSSEALQCLYRGISNRAVGETQMNLSSSRSHCVYLFSVQQECEKEGMIKSGKIVLVDLAGSEKVEKTGAEGRVLVEAKTINKSLSALGNVINALTTGRVNHVPFRDSKLTRILQDALGGNSRTALLCCCSLSSSNASESLSTLRFGTRSKLIKTQWKPKLFEDKGIPKQVNYDDNTLRGQKIDTSGNLASVKILNKLKESLSEKSINLLEELFMLEGIYFYPHTTEESESTCDSDTIKTTSALEQAVADQNSEIEKLENDNMLLKKENELLKIELRAAMNLCLRCIEAVESFHTLKKRTGIISFVSRQ